MAHRQGMTGFQEGVVGVLDLDATTETFCRVGGWEIVAEEEGSPLLAEFWRAPGARLRQRVLRNPGAERGYLRLVQFAGVTQKYIRDQAAPWDTGGFFDFYIPVSDVDCAFEDLRRRGWQGYAPFLDYKSVMGNMRYIIAHGPEGLSLCLIQFEAPLDFVRGLDRAPFGLPFNITMTVPSEGYAAAHAFFAETLGWNIYYQGAHHVDPPGGNPLGLPLNIAIAHDRPLTVFVNHPSDRMGSLMIMGFDGVTGYDRSGDAGPPHLGLFAARVPVADVRDAVKRIAAKGGEILAEPVEIDIAPYGRSLVFATQTPHGARIELFGPSKA